MRFDKKKSWLGSQGAITTHKKAILLYYCSRFTKSGDDGPAAGGPTGRGWLRSWWPGHGAEPTGRRRRRRPSWAVVGRRGTRKRRTCMVVEVEVASECWSVRARWLDQLREGKAREAHLRLTRSGGWYDATRKSREDTMLLSVFPWASQHTALHIRFQMKPKEWPRCGG